MDPGSLSLSVSVIMLCLLGAARCAADGKSSCSCATIPLMELTEKPNQNCSIVNGRFRYTCKEGYKRQAGTSNLIKCVEVNGIKSWTSSILICIPDPNRTTQPPKSTVTTAHTHSPHDVTTTSISSTITASTSVQTTHSESTSASGITQTNSAEAASSGRQDQDTPGPSQAPEEVTKLQTTAKTDQTSSTSTTTKPSNITANSLHDTTNCGRQFKPPDKTPVVIACVSLMIICASIGVSFYYCRRKRKQNISQEKTETTEEQVPMNEP